ncbi:hypothetical protein ACFB49_46890 [Sphingomonas sp. DBB INV C78]
MVGRGGDPTDTSEAPPPLPGSEGLAGVRPVELDPEPLPEITLNTALLLADPVKQGRICIDFGTAASKIALEPDGGYFEPLEIGKEDGSDPFWVRSLIALDAEGRMVFGQRAKLAGDAGLPVLTSFKSKLWGAPAVLEAVALEHDGIRFTYRDCIQAYLGFLTQLGALRLEDQGMSPWTPRRYAMPFAYDAGRRHVREALGTMLGRAAILADTFGVELVGGVDTRLMRAALNAVKSLSAPDWLLAEPGCVGEPVAAGAFAMDQELNNQTVYMIADVGAGTTDFCILCLKKLADGDLVPIQIRDGALSVEVAGDAVDAALVEFLVEEQAGEEHRGRLALDAPDLKERLFAATAADDEQFDHELPGQFLINVSRQDFLRSSHWANFVRELCESQARCFDGADRTYLQQYGDGAIRVVVTGGGSALPLRDALAEGRSEGSVRVWRVAVTDFPTGVRDRFDQILDRLPRLAVALGGSRELLPTDHDRSCAITSPGYTPAYVVPPFDKTKTGFEDE